MTTRPAGEGDRLDLELVRRGLAPSRTRAQALVRAARVTMDGRTVTRPAEAVPRGAALAVTPGDDFVSRGGKKLDAALAALGVDVSGMVVVDVGASTGGFTDAVLQRGALRVYAVDVGHGQLDPRLRADPRVVSREGVNARDLRPADFPEPIALVLVDASFIGLGKLLPALVALLPPGGHLILLVKPQFEVGPELARRGRGVVRDVAARAAAIAGVRAAVTAAGLTVLGEVDSALPGPRGNRERFLHARR